MWWWLAWGEVRLGSKARSQSVCRLDVIACDGVLDGTWRKGVHEEPQCVDPSGFAVPREEFFIESYLAFRVDAGCGLTWGPLDGAVDGFVLEVFVDVADIAGASYH